MLELAPERIVGQLSVASTVQGRASVRSTAGETVGHGETPLQLSLPPGTYEISLSATGYLPWTGFARIDAEKTAEVRAVPQLAPAPTGSLTVTSNVPGAVIELDGEPAGFSPTVLSNVKAGTYTLRVNSPALVPWSGKVAVAADERSWLTVSLEEPPEEQISAATYIAGGVAAVGLIAGGILAFLAAQTHDDFETAAADSDRSALRERGETLNTAADIALITAGAAAATTLVLYLTTGEVSGRPSSAALTRTPR